MAREPQKEFDAVATVRGIRDRVSERIKDMSAEEQRSWLSSQVAADAKLKRLMERAAHQKPAADGA